MTPRWLTLRQAGVLVALDVGGPHLPRIVHWGADVPDDPSVLAGAGYEPPAADSHTSAVPVTVLPARAQGWTGRPGLSGHRSGVATQPLFTLVDVTASPDCFTYRGLDTAAELRLDGELTLTVDGVLRHRHTLTNLGEPYTVDDLITLLPVSQHATEVLDHAGRWCREAAPQRVSLGQGTWLREQRHGRTGHDSPLLLAVGTPGFGYRNGELWGVHLGWSGDQCYLAQRLDSGVTVLGAGELLGSGEVLLGSGESFTTPWVYGVWSDSGLDGAAARLHAMLRRRPSHPRTPRPVVLNTWEAVYFDHSFERLAALADAAASVGVERFVIDDGWFGSRRTDRSGLGDWYVSPDVWPSGLAPIADYVRQRGMDFGLWFEPEMVNPDSELAREHPDWLLGTAGRLPPPQRSQHVLDVSRPDAFAYLLEHISALVTECGIAYLKWDHNRDTLEPVHRTTGRPALHDQITAAYRLMAALKQRHPGLEIESCSSGGARIDYGVLEHTDRVWPSDCSDPVERVGIIAELATLLPFEVLGAHVASARSHTTGRVHDLDLRLAVALFGHSGIEWDLTTLSADEHAAVAQWVARVKRLRGLVHSGTLVRVERATDPGTRLFGVVSADRREALFLFARLSTDPRIGSAPLRLAGLAPDRRYRVGEQAVSGAALMRVGIDAPDLPPEQATVLHLTAVDQA